MNRLASWSKRRGGPIAACVLVSISILGLIPVRPRAEENAAPLRLCVDPDNLPFSSASATPPGFYIELGEQIARTLGRPFQPVWVPTFYTKRQIRMKLLAGRCDGFVGVPDDASFMGPRLIFTQPIIQLGYALVAPAAMAVNNVESLHGKRVAVQYSTPPQTLLAGETDVQMVTVLSPEEAIRDLADGKADAAFIWGASAGWLNLSVLHGADRVVPIGGEHTQWGASIAFRQDQTDLRDSVDHALAGLGTTISALSVKYGFPAPAAVSPASSDDNGGSAGVPPSAAGGATATALRAEDVAAGRKLFNTTCAHCHGPDAVQGEQRRNLRMLRERYGNDFPQMFMNTVTHGRVSKGMPNWSGIISDDEFRKILAFLTSVQEPGS